MDIKSAVTAITLVLSLNANAIVINEFLPNAIGADSGNEWVELFNNSKSSIDIGGWGIQKATSSYQTVFVIPTGTVLLSGEHFVIGGSNVIEADLNLDIGNYLGFGNAGSSGDALRLIDQLNNAIDTVIYGPNNNDGFLDDTGVSALFFAPTPTVGGSLGRLIDGFDTNNSGNDFAVFENATLGRLNQTSVVPTPSALWLFASGLLGMISIGRKNK